MLRNDIAARRWVVATIVCIAAAVWCAAALSAGEIPTKSPAGPTSQASSLPASAPAVWAAPDVKQQSAEYRRLLEALTCPKADGRGPGTPGIDFARDFIVDEMKACGLQPGVGESYFETFQTSLGITCKEQLLEVLDKDGKVVVDGKAGEAYNTVGISADGNFKQAAVFAGYGLVDPARKYNSYADAASRSVRGKVVVIFRYEPMDDKGKSIWSKSDGWTDNSALVNKAFQAQKQGAAAMLIVDPPSHKTDLLTTRSSSMVPRATIPVFHISQDFFDRMLAAGQKNPPTAAELQSAANEGKAGLVDLGNIRVRGRCTLETVTGKLSNVVGVLPGRGELQKQVVFIGGHYDHLGHHPLRTDKSTSQPADDCCWGADDNASGTSGMLLLAKWLTSLTSQDQRPRRTVVFAAFSGEELGLLGSHHMIEHLSDLKITPDQIVAMLNFDMIGRLQSGRLQIFGVDSGDQWRALIGAARLPEGMKLQLGSSGNGPSDHATFFAKHIPVLHFFTGMHADVHSPRDTADKINCDGAVQVLDLGCQLADVVIHDPKRIAFSTKSAGPGNTAGKPYLGLMLAPPDTEGKGCRIDDVTEDGPAYNAGVKAGDVVTGWDQSTINKADDLFALLDAAKPGQKVAITVSRDGKKITVTVTLGGK